MIHDVLRQFVFKIGLKRAQYTYLAPSEEPFLTNNKKLRTPTPNFEKKLSEDIMDHQQYLFGIYLSHI